MPNSILRMHSNQVRSRLSSDGSGAQLIDVQTPIEFESEHIAEAVNIPLGDLNERGNEIRKGVMSVIVCRTGNRAARAADILAQHGYEVGILEGGMVQWKKDGMPAIEGKKRLSIERQTQLSIGLILLVSTTAGFAIHQAFFAFSALVGAGLTFAGLSGTCGLGLLLTKAPWNKLTTHSIVSRENIASKSDCCS